MPKVDISGSNRRGDKKTRYLMLNVTRNCNLNCLYCYENNRDRSKQIMDFDLAKKMTSEYMQRNDEYKEVVIDFFWGEPLLAFPLIRKVVKWVKERTWHKEYVFSLSTNGTILSNDIKDWISKNRQNCRQSDLKWIHRI